MKKLIKAFDSRFENLHVCLNEFGISLEQVLSSVNELQNDIQNKKLENSQNTDFYTLQNLGTKKQLFSLVLKGFLSSHELLEEFDETELEDISNLLVQF